MTTTNQPSTEPERNGLEKLQDSYEALGHVAAHGWARPKGEKTFSAKVRQDSSQINHDPEAVARHDICMDKLLALINDYRDDFPDAPVYWQGLYEYFEENNYQGAVRKLDKELTKIADDINGWLIDRQIKVLGCNPPDDCHTIDRVCGHASMKGCGLGRK